MEQPLKKNKALNIYGRLIVCVKNCYVIAVNRAFFSYSIIYLPEEYIFRPRHSGNHTFSWTPANS